MICSEDQEQSQVLMTLPKLASKVHFHEGLHEDDRDGKREHPCLFLKFRNSQAHSQAKHSALDLGFEEHLNMFLSLTF